MAQPLMPKATAVWLIDNTALTFDQIGEFCGLHKLEVQALADGEVGPGMIGSNPVMHNELTADEIKRCEEDPAARLQSLESNLPKPQVRSKGPKYTPVAKRGDKPDAIAWLLKNHPELADSQIARLIGTTKPTISNIRDRTHANMTNIKPQHPIELGLCSRDELEKAIAKAERAAERAAKKAEKEARAAQKNQDANAAADVADAPVAGAEDAQAPQSNTDSSLAAIVAQQVEEVPAAPAPVADAAQEVEVEVEVEVQASQEEVAEEPVQEEAAQEESPVEDSAENPEAETNDAAPEETSEETPEETSEETPEETSEETSEEEPKSETA